MPFSIVDATIPFFCGLFVSLCHCSSSLAYYFLLFDVQNKSRGVLVALIEAKFVFLTRASINGNARHTNLTVAITKEGGAGPAKFTIRYKLFWGIWLLCNYQNIYLPMSLLYSNCKQIEDETSRSISKKID